MNEDAIDYSKYTIHIVDDSKSVIVALSSTLIEKGYKVSASENGKDAILSILKDPPALIILDVEMPVLDGYETIKRLKKNIHTAHIPVIFHTSLTRPDIIKNLFELQAADYISKPFVPEELLARVEKEIRTLNLQNMLKEKMAKLAELLSMDPLTKTSNKLHMTSLINTHLENFKKTGHDSFSIIYIDIDNFNEFTKQNGIIYANSALKIFAKVINQCIRQKDTLSHWDGDTFMVLLPQVSDEDLENIAKNIQDRVTNTPFPSNSHLSCSIVIYVVEEKDTFTKILTTLKSRIQILKKQKKNSILNASGQLLH